MHENLEEFLLKEHQMLFQAKEENNYPFAGFECGDGWFPLIDELLLEIADHIDRKLEWSNQHEHLRDFRIEQVKEKFGSLRVYTTASTPEIKAYLDMASRMSSRICEFCGSPGIIRKEAWLSCKCEECFLHSETNADRLAKVPDRMLALITRKSAQ